MSASNLDEERTGIVWVPNYLAARRYRLVRRVGSGGMADVWLAHDTTLDREVALKRVPSQVGYDARGLADLKREATTAMALTHEYIVRIHNLESDGREYFLDMEYVSGGSVADRLARLGRLDPDEVTQLGIRLCEALAYAHRQGVVHRDIKPGNILLTESGEPKLADFGIAYALAATMRRVSNLAGVGTVAYMAPEQIRGQPPSHQTDLYQLGVTLYQCVSGRVPFEDGYVPGQILEAEPPPLEGVPSTLAAAIGRSLVKDPAQRPDGATELAKLLAGRAPVAETERPPAGASGSPPVRERPTPAGLPAGATMSPEGSTSPADASGDVNHAVSPGRELQEYAEPTKPRPGEADASEKRRRWVVGVVILAGVLILVAMAATAIIMNQAGTGGGSDGVGASPDPVNPVNPPSSEVRPEPAPSAPSNPLTLTLAYTLTQRNLLTGIGPGSNMAFSPDGRLLASGSVDNTKLWDVATGSELRTLSGMGASLAFSPDGRTLSSSSWNSTIKLWDVATGNELRTIAAPRLESAISLAFSADGRMLASFDGKMIAIRDVATGNELRGFGGFVKSLAFSPDGRLLASGSITIKLWDVATGSELRTLAGHKGSNLVLSLAFSPDGRMLASASMDKTIKLWDVATGDELRTLSGHKEQVECVAFSPDGRVLASSSGDKTLKLWKPATGAELGTYADGSDFAVGRCSVAFSPDGRLLASSAGNTRLWRITGAR